MGRRSTGLLTLAGRERGFSLRGRITKTLASCCIARLLVLASEHNEQPIVLRIDSPGGLVADSLPVISTMKGIKCPIATFCWRDIGNSAVVIAACGLPGYRSAAPGAKFSFNPLGGGGSELESDRKFLHVLADILAERTHKPEEEVLRWLTEGAIFSAEQAKANGLVDLISAKPSLPPA